MTNEQKTMINTLRAEGLGYKRIADKMGLSINTVKSFCKRSKPIETVNLDNSVTKCKNCGRTIEQTPGRKEKKFCSDKCRMEWWNSHLDLVNRKAIYEHRCPACGRTFSVYGDAKRKYCSHECYVNHRFGGRDGQ